jgi:hypothetical protein
MSRTLLTSIVSPIALAGLLAVLSWPHAPEACAQGVDTTVGSATGTASAQPEQSPFLLEPDVQIKGDNIKSQTYNTQPAGQNKNWNLDIGRFQPQVKEDPNRLADDIDTDYSGMRLRLPFRGRTAQ